MPDLKAPPEATVFDEWYFLACLARKANFFYRYVQHINRPWRSRLNFKFQDFTNAYANKIFEVLRMYYTGAPKSEACTQAFFSVGLQGLVDSGLLMAPEIPQVYEIVENLYKVEERDLPSLEAYYNEDCVGKWLSKRRGTQIINLHGTMLDLEKLREVMDIEAEPLGVANLRPVAFGSTLDLKKLVSQPVLLTPFSKLNSCIYGLMPGDYSIFASAQSGGKTIMALQLAGYWARNTQLNVLFVSTEQSISELEARMISCYADVPISQIVGGLDDSVLSPDQKDRANDFRERTRGKLFWIDWSREFGADAQRLGHLLDTYKRDLGLDFHVVLFDFIGGGMGDLSGNKIQYYRLLMQQTSDYLATLARQRDMVVIGTAQIDVKVGYKKRRLDMMDLSENKTLAKKAANFIGISALKDDAENSTGTFQTYQYLYCGKPRKGPGGEVRIRRDMTFQRFVQVT